MICTFCGTDNPLVHRFCGGCGVRLERRKGERRTNGAGINMCPDCGHSSEKSYKFCGICGARIDRREKDRRGIAESPEVVASAGSQRIPESRRSSIRREPATVDASTATLVETSPAVRKPREVVEPSPLREPAESSTPVSVGGPSFLGLNASHTDTEYLLHDERSPRHGLRILILFILLAGIGVLLYVQYRSSVSGKHNPQQPSKPTPVSGPQSLQNGAQPAEQNPASQNNAVKTAAAARDLQTEAASVASSASSIADSPDAQDGNTNGAERESPPVAKKPAKNAKNKKSEKTAEAGLEADAKPSPALVKAQRYLHGQGVHRNCEQGLIYLKAAARENDPQAAVQMGSLYSTGVCVQQDRVKAYEWFVSARDMQPDNRWLAKNLTQLWAQMTPQERRQIHQ